jgi:hypothetical protein
MDTICPAPLLRACHELGAILKVTRGSSGKEKGRLVNPPFSGRPEGCGFQSLGAALFLIILIRGGRVTATAPRAGRNHRFANYSARRLGLLFRSTGRGTTCVRANRLDGLLGSGLRRGWFLRRDRGVSRVHRCAAESEHGSEQSRDKLVLHSISSLRLREIDSPIAKPYQLRLNMPHGYELVLAVKTNLNARASI